MARVLVLDGADEEELEAVSQEVIRKEGNRLFFTSEHALHHVILHRIQFLVEHIFINYDLLGAQRQSEQ